MTALEFREALRHLIALEKKMRALLLQAVPVEIQEYCFARSRTAVAQLLVEVCVDFSPGNAQDRAALLRGIHSPPAPGSTKDAFTAIRKWHRQLARVAVCSSPGLLNISPKYLLGRLLYLKLGK